MAITIDDLPNEILWLIYPHLDLESLIFAQGVSRLWRSLVPLSDIHPIRRKYYNLYLKAIESAVFVYTRPYILPSLRDFDREQFVSQLPVGTSEEFTMWILEWPAKAVFGSIWPGLPVNSPCSPPRVNLTYHGLNKLSLDGKYSLPLQIEKVTIIHPDDPVRWDHPGGSYWYGLPWQEMAVRCFTLSLLHICQASIDHPGGRFSHSVDLVLEATGGGKMLCGTLPRLEYGIGRFNMASGWFEFFESELIIQEAMFTNNETL